MQYHSSHGVLCLMLPFTVLRVALPQGYALLKIPRPHGYGRICTIYEIHIGRERHLYRECFRLWMQRIFFFPVHQSIFEDAFRKSRESSISKIVPKLSAMADGISVILMSFPVITLAGEKMGPPIKIIIIIFA